MEKTTLPTLEEQREAIERKRDQAKDQAHKAQTLLDNPLLKDALSQHSDACFRNWCRTQPDETDVRERIYHEWNAGRVFQEWLRRTVQSGKVADVTAARVLADGSRSPERNN